jgi:hypothetical protein
MHAGKQICPAGDFATKKKRTKLIGKGDMDKGEP